MDIYILNSEFSRDELVEEFESFVWTERYSGYGDFEIVVTPTRKNKNRLKTGVYLSTSESKKLMKIEKRHITESDDGVEEMKLTGRGLETILDSRIVYPNWLGENMDKTYVAEGQAGKVIAKLITDMCVIGEGSNPNNVIPELEVIDQTGTTDLIDIALQPGSLYDAVKSLCEEHKLGIRVDFRKGHSKPFALYIFKGVDRPKLVFSSTLDNLAQESYLNDITNFKNVAYVSSKDGDRIVEVHSYGANWNTTGLNRNCMWVDTDIDTKKYTEPKLTKILESRGRAALKEHRKKFLMDGVVTNLNLFKYGVHYNLGDTLYVMDEHNNRTPKVVEEYIWAWDGEGLRSYPTFASNE